MSQKVDRYHERPVFNQWTPDSPEVVNQCFNHDKNNWNIPKFCVTPKEQTQVETLIVIHFHAVKALYHYL